MYYELSRDTNLELGVYDITGKEVAQLASGYCMAGYHTVSWDAGDHSGCQNTGDIYLLRLLTGEYSKTIKIMNL